MKNVILIDLFKQNKIETYVTNKEMNKKNCNKRL